MSVEEDAQRTERRLNEHADRIRALEIKDAAQTEKIDTLCVKLGELSDQIKALMEFMKNSLWKAIGAMGSIILVLLAFFFWYVQHLT